MYGAEQMLYRPEQAAEMLSISRSKLYELLATGELESVKVARSRRVPRAALDIYVERLRQGAGSTAA